MLQKKVIEKKKFPVNVFRKSCHLWGNVEKYGTAKEATDDNTVRSMRIACWLTEATDTHTQNI